MQKHLLESQKFQMTTLCNYQKSSLLVSHIEIQFVLCGAKLFRLKSEGKSIKNKTYFLIFWN